MTYAKSTWLRLRWSGIWPLVRLAMLTCLAVSCTHPRIHSQDSPVERVLVDVLYGTNRQIDSHSSVSTYYGGRRGDLTYGLCKVSVSVARNQLTRFSEPNSWPDDSDFVSQNSATLRVIKRFDVSTFGSLVKNSVRQSGQRVGLVYIHGYDKTFIEAVENLARLIYEINFKGPVFVYSWPSGGSKAAYAADIAAVDWSVNEFDQFLSQVEANDQLDTLHLVAHSLGNRALLSVLVDRLSGLQSSESWRYGEVVLIAPDVDKLLFERDMQPLLSQSPTRVSLYISSEDVPLKISKFVNLYPRLGDARFGPRAYAGIETIDVSPSSTFLKGHSYFRREAEVLEDLHRLLVLRKGASERPHLSPQQENDGIYWYLDPSWE